MLFLPRWPPRLTYNVGETEEHSTKRHPMKASLLAVLTILPFVAHHARGSEQAHRPTQEESIQSFKLVFEMEIPKTKMFESNEGRDRIINVIVAALSSPGWKWDKAIVTPGVNTGIGVLRSSRHDGAKFPVKTIVPAVPWATLIWEDDDHWKVVLDAHWSTFVPVTREGKRGTTTWKVLQPRDTGQSK